MSLGKSLDGTLNTGEEVRFKQKHKKLMTYLAKQCHLTYDEIEHLAVLYYKLQVSGDGKHVPLSRSTIIEVLHHGFDITNHTLLSYMIGLLDKSLTPSMSLENWIRMLSLFLRGTFDEKLKFCFSVYLSTGISDKLIRNTIIFLMKCTLYKDEGEADEEAIKDLVDMLIKRMDKDRDGKISFDDYKQAVKENPAFLESFGKILPDRLPVFTLKNTFMPKLKDRF